MDNTPEGNTQHQSAIEPQITNENASDQSKAVVEKFMKRFAREKKYYDGIATEAENICEAALNKEGIQAEYKSRGKESRRLRAKCMRRIEKDHQVYRNESDIYDNIRDLAGVRIALYFPNQKVNVSKLIKQHFIIDDEKEHTGQEHKGYVATHYFVRLKPKEIPDEPGELDDPSDGIIEIQVMSVLRNAWSNVGHDIVYKAIHGSVSEQEISILDGLEGILSAGDWFLNTFHNTYIDRVKSKNSPFANHFELGTYLSKQFSKHIQKSEGGMKLGLVQVLHDLLEILVNAEEEKLKSSHSLERQARKPKLNTPQGLDIIINEISLEDVPGSKFYKLVKGFGECEMTISVYIMNHILAEFANISDQEPAQDARRLKLKVMLSTMLWLDELFPTSFAFEDNLVEHGEEREQCLVKWMYKHTDVRMVFKDVKLGDDQARKVDQYVDEAWQFFTRSSSKPDADPVVQFAFKLSKTGVLWEFPEDFARLEKRTFGQDLPFPTWNDSKV